jgi:hypothetical protein
LEYLTVKNWSKFQHYKNRTPPWIKLHRDLLRDYDFCRLPDVSKAHLMLLWVLASQMDNKIPNDPKWIQEQLGLEKKINLKELINHGFVSFASRLQADCKQSAIIETEKETEKERPSTGVDGIFDKSKIADCPHAKIINLYHEVLPELPMVRAWTEERQGFLRSRWREEVDRQNLDWWRSFFIYIKQSDFLMGRKLRFKANLEWLVRPTNFIKVLEGHYENDKRANTY